MRARTSAPPTWRRSTSIARASRARSAICRCMSSAMPARPPTGSPTSLGRALQLTNILRDLDEDAAARPALSAARDARPARHPQRPTRLRCCAIRHCRRSAATWPRSPRRISRRASGDGALLAPRDAAGRGDGRRSTARCSRRCCARAGATRPRASACRSRASCGWCCATGCYERAPGRVHVVGAGLAGLAAAVALGGDGRQRRALREPASMPAGAAARISMPSSAAGSTTAIICCSPATARRWTISGRSARSTRSTARPRRPFRSSIWRPASAGAVRPNRGALPWWML